MKMNKIRVAKATVNGNESLIFIVVDPRRAQSPQLHILAWQLINKFSLKTRLNKLS